MAKKNVTFRVFEIKSSGLTSGVRGLGNLLLDKLRASNVERRLIPVNENDNSLNDLLGAFATNSSPSEDSFVYGVMMRLKPAKEIKALPDNFQQLSELDESELLEIQEVAGKIVCSNLYHFLIQGRYLVTDLPQIQTIAGFQRYLSKLLMSDAYTFVPYLIQKDLRLKDIRSVTFKDSLAKVETLESSDNTFSLRKVASAAIKRISPQVKSLNKILEDRMLSARMVIDFECPRGMSQEDYARKLSSILAPIQDLDNVYFSLSNGMKLQGSDLLYTHKEVLEDEVITSETYIRSMRRVLNSL